MAPQVGEDNSNAVGRQLVGQLVISAFVLLSAVNDVDQGSGVRGSEDGRGQVKAVRGFEG